MSLTRDQLTQALEQPEQFTRQITSASQLCELAIAYPDLAEQLYAELKDLAQYYRFVHNSFDLQILAETFPTHKDALLAPLFKDENLFQSVLTCIAGMNRLGKLFPTHGDVFGQASLTDAMDVVFGKKTANPSSVAGAFKAIPGLRSTASAILPFLNIKEGVMLGSTNVDSSSTIETKHGHVRAMLTRDLLDSLIRDLVRAHYAEYFKTNEGQNIKKLYEAVLWELDQEAAKALAKYDMTEAEVQQFEAKLIQDYPQAYTPHFQDVVQEAFDHVIQGINYDSHFSKFYRMAHLETFIHAVAPEAKSHADGDVATKENTSKDMGNDSGGPAL